METLSDANVINCLCGTKSVLKENKIECIDCGEYRIDESAKEELISALGKESDDNVRERKKANILGYIKENPGLHITGSSIHFLMNIRTPIVAERAEKLMKWFEKRIEIIGDLYSYWTVRKKLMRVSYSLKNSELDYLIKNYLSEEKKYVAIGKDDTNMPCIRITPKGYAYLESLNKNSNSLMGFVAMWFDESMNPVWENAICPAIQDAGYDPKRIDKHEHTEGVVDEIISLIRQSRFLIADLTSEPNKARGGVYYEAGFAKGLGLNVIFTCEEGYFEERHFDVQHYNCLKWKKGGYEDFKKKLRNRIEACIGRVN